MNQISDDCFAHGGDMMLTADALAILTARISPLGDVERILPKEAAGRVLAADVRSCLKLPPHDNSAVDGYALRHADLRPDADTRLSVSGLAAAGRSLEGEWRPGGAVRIFTGALMPDGCDTVIMQEDVRREGDDVIIPPGARAGANRRRAGEDVGRGDVVLGAGLRLRPDHVAMAAASGQADLPVFRRPRVALFSTGDELAEAGATRREGAIYDANRPMLRGLLAAAGCDVEDLGILPDDPEVLTAALSRAAADNDAIITSGGVSMGDEDHVKMAVQRLGSLHFWRLAIKPGRPVALGAVAGRLFVGLPGNPVAAMVCFILFARTALLRLGGVSEAGLAPRRYMVRAGFSASSKAGRREWIRASLHSDASGWNVAEAFPRQGSGIISSLNAADGLVEVEEERTAIAPGDAVLFLPFSEVLS